MPLAMEGFKGHRAGSGPSPAELDEGSKGESRDLGYGSS
jgi:hypothetical protein